MTKRPTFSLYSDQFDTSVTYLPETGEITLEYSTYDSRSRTFSSLREWDSFIAWINDANQELHLAQDRKTISREAQPPTAVS